MATLPDNRLLIIGIAIGWFVGSSQGILPLVLTAFVSLCIIAFVAVLWAFTDYIKGLGQ